VSPAPTRFQFDQTADGRILKLLHVVDEFTARRSRSSPARIDSDATVATLDRLVAARGASPPTSAAKMA
jgi:putative transposase